MAITINYTTSGVSATVEHYNSTQGVYPRYYVDIALDTNMQLSIKFRHSGYDDKTGFFGYNVGYKVVGSNGAEIIDITSSAWYFGNSASGDPDRQYGYDASNYKYFSVDLSSFSFPITLDILCQGCDSNKANAIEITDGSGHITIVDARHTHISAPVPPVITETTGKSITVSDYKDGVYCITTNSGYHNTGSPVKFTSYIYQGKEYTFKCRQNCTNCPDGYVYESSTVTGKTWNISGSLVASGANSIVFKAAQTAGTTGGTASSHTITYKLYTSKSTSGTVIATKKANNNIPVTFTDLTPGTTYYCYAYTTDITDNDCWIGGENGASTKTATTVLGNDADVSATTLRASVSWNPGGATSVACIIYCNGNNNTITSSGNYVGFTGLTPGVNYPVSWVVTSIYHYTYKYNVTENGQTVEKTGTIEDILEIEGSTSLTTKQTTLNISVSDDITSKIIRFKSSSNYASDVMEQRISSNTTWDTIEQDEYFIYNNLTHNTSYTIYARIAECYAFDSFGNETSINDSEISNSVSTKLLSLQASISEEHQHSLITLWQSYVDGKPIDSDAIDGTAFEFIDIDTIAKKNNPPYQASEVIEGSNGNTIGNYQTDKKIYSNNLTWYYCEYIVSATITDGYNIVAYAIKTHTIFPAAWIHSNGQWHRYMGHVYTNGEYVPAPVFVYKNNNYIEPNGE